MTQEEFNQMLQVAIAGGLSGYATSKYSLEEIEEKLDGGGTGGGVSSFNSRTGEVIPQTGDYTAEMVGAAPGGFGLGGNAKVLTSKDDLNAIWQNGWYYWGLDIPKNAPNQATSSAAYTFMRVTGASNANLIQDYWSLNLGNHYQSRRVNYNRTWSPLEWYNPPMALGVEYRTTERHNGKPVYTKLIDCGAMPNNTAKTVEYTDDVSARPISVTGIWDGGNATMPGETGPSGFPAQLQNISLLNRNVLISTHSDRSSSTASAIVKYWKTTD